VDGRPTLPLPDYGRVARHPLASEGSGKAVSCSCSCGGTQVENSPGVLTQELVLDFRRQPERTDLLGASIQRELGEVATEQHLVFAIGLEEVHQRWRVVRWQVSGGVDEHIVMLPC